MCKQTIYLGLETSASSVTEMPGEPLFEPITGDRSFSLHNDHHQMKNMSQQKN